MLILPAYRTKFYWKPRKKKSIQQSSVKNSSVHLKRIPAEISPVGPLGSQAMIVPVRIILNDLTKDEVSLFSTMSFPFGQEVAVRIKTPGNFYVKGYVISCYEISSPWRIISETPFQYRMQIRFDFRSKSEESAVRWYCEEFLPEHTRIFHSNNHEI
ncbi:MAG: hypothetical protein AABZ06_00805 [Bdellovibrionota bacterium]